jgi:hypothetical protein
MQRLHFTSRVSVQSLPARTSTAINASACTERYGAVLMRRSGSLAALQPMIVPTACRSHACRKPARLLQKKSVCYRHSWAGRQMSGFLVKRQGSRILRHEHRGPRAATAGATMPLADDKWSLYEALGIAKDVGLGEVKSAYRQLARRYHPDVCAAEERTECVIKFIEVSTTASLLSGLLLSISVPVQGFIHLKITSENKTICIFKLKRKISVLYYETGC